MKKRIYIYELDCYKVASEEQIQRMRISPERYFCNLTEYLTKRTF